jgi:hypothetical protein
MLLNDKAIKHRSDRVAAKGENSKRYAPKAYDHLEAYLSLPLCTAQGKEVVC